MVQKFLGFGSKSFKKKLFLFILFTLVTTVSVLKSREKIFCEEVYIRKPVVAGQFYPGNPKILEKQIEQFLTQAKPPETKGEILALILPHAGYQYCGQVAAYGFKKLIGEDIDTVIIIGNSHYAVFPGASIPPSGKYLTPLGEVEIDSELAQEIIKENKNFIFQREVDRREHSLEVLLPFLQKTIKNFKIVPILLGNYSGQFQILAPAIAKNIKGKNVILIASSDLSHYPSQKNACYVDNELIKAILTGKTENVDRAILNLQKQKIEGVETFACGLEAIKTVMEVAKELKANEIKLLNYANSGDTSGEKNRVVGYGAIGFFGERRGNLLNKFEKKKLLEIARKSVETYVKTGKIPEFEATETGLQQNLGVFVTIKKSGVLRGCLGRFSPVNIPLYKLVPQMAVASATQDPRFFPIKSSELKDLSYEISVLSPLEKIDDWKKIIPGKHGVQISRGFRSGVFLPQVASEFNWDLETFLNELAENKAGLPKDSWKDKNTNLYIFTAQVFSEEQN